MIQSGSPEEPSWNHIDMNKDTTYTIRVHADFEEKTVSYSITEKDGKVAAQEIAIPTEAFQSCKDDCLQLVGRAASVYRYFRLTAPEAKTGSAAGRKTLYAFGDSIVAGHQYTKHSFAGFHSRSGE